MRQRWLTLHVINVDVNIYMAVTWINMLEEIIHKHIQSLTVINVKGRLHDLVIWGNISGPVMVVKLLFQLLLQLLKNVVLMLILSLNCERLVNHLEVLFTVHCEYEGSKEFISTEESYSCLHVTKFQQEHHAYKFQIAVSVVFHKVVDSAIITQPPALASEMVAVYADAAPPLDDVNHQLLSFKKVYEHNGSGWVFSNLSSL